ncbi:MAG: outer membrane lipoprotein-sorting protein [Desulfovibrionaceae bacterium]|nr:outer membrane lipoprotein-sorting protein [Desulfovibrionaceae bacterium]
MALSTFVPSAGRALLLLAAGLVLAALAASSAASAAPLTGRDVAKLVYDRPNGEDRVQVCTMTLTNQRGATRVRRLEMRSKDYGEDQKSIMIFREPADIQNTMFLSFSYEEAGRDDDRWLYMPAMKNVRRISGSSKNEYFMGTDFTYDDLGKRSVDKDTHELLGEEDLDGRRCWKLESKPVDPDDGYVRRVSWVDQEAHVTVRTDYYDRDGLQKTLRVLDLQKRGGIWTTMHSEMNNVSRNHRTELKVESIEYDTGLSDSLFRVATLQRGRL